MLISEIYPEVGNGEVIGSYFYEIKAISTKDHVDDLLYSGVINVYGTLYETVMGVSNYPHIVKEVIEKVIEINSVFQDIEGLEKQSNLFPLENYTLMELTPVLSKF